MNHALKLAQEIIRLDDQARKHGRIMSRLDNLMGRLPSQTERELVGTLENILATEVLQATWARNNLIHTIADM
jgi:hypothetical protein